MGPGQQMMLLQRADALLAGSQCGPAFRRKASRPQSLFGAQKIVCAQLINFAMSFRSRLACVSLRGLPLQVSQGCVLQARRLQPGLSRNVSAAPSAVLSGLILLENK